MRTIILVMWLSGFPLAINAQQTADLRIGVRVQVTDQSRHKATGTLQSLSNDSLTYIVGDSAIFKVSLSKVQLIQVSRGRNHARGALKGGLIGIGLGILTGGTIGGVTYKKPQSCEWFCLRNRRAATAFGGALGGIAGVTLGLVMGTVIGVEEWDPVFWRDATH